MKLIAIQSSDGVYLSLETPSRYTSDIGLTKDVNIFLFDGEQATPTFHKDWVLVKQLPEEITKRQSGGFERYYILKSPDKFPDLRRRWEYDEANESYDLYAKEFAEIASLYERHNDPLPDIYVSIPFSVQIVGSIEKLPEKGDFSYDWVDPKETSWSKGGKKALTECALKHPILAEITTPSLLMHTAPCELNSKQTYGLIREHVKTHIDPKVARVTSDYGFCFSVSKVISKAKPESYQIDVNNQDLFQKRKRKPNWETRYRQSREVQVFEMTWSPECYKGYTPIKPFKAGSQGELKEMIDNYLENLMAMINEPLQDCPHCQGAGVQLDHLKVLGQIGETA